VETVFSPGQMHACIAEDSKKTDARSLVEMRKNGGLIFDLVG